MKKIVSSKSNLVQCAIGVLMFTPLSLLCFMHDIACLIESEPAGPGFLWGSIFLLLLLFFLFCMNRFACLIWVEDGVVKRKGLFWGFRKECPIESISKVKIQYSSAEKHNTIYLIDDSKHKFDGFWTDSYISFKKSKKNMAFLKSFWTGEIIE